MGGTNKMSFIMVNEKEWERLVKEGYATVMNTAGEEFLVMNTILIRKTPTAFEYEQNKIDGN
jgi:hypothetical protein